VINRLVDPVAECNLPDWFADTALPELMGCTLKGAGNDRFYRISDKLLDLQISIEAHISKRQQSLFNLDRTVLLYDLTNTHFEGVCEANPKALYGKNKQKRTDCPQVVVGMVFDAQGFAVAHRLFDGNQGDAASLSTMLETLDGAIAPSPAKPMIIMDAGLASAANRKLLNEKGYLYLVNDSRGVRKKYKEQFDHLERFAPVEGRPLEKEVLVHAMEDPQPNKELDRPEQIVLCHSAARAEKEQAMLSRAEVRMIDQLKKLAARISSGKLKESAKIDQAITCLLLLMPFVVSILSSFVSAHYPPPPGVMAESIENRGYRLRLIGQSPFVDIIWYGPYGHERHHALDVCMQFRGIRIEPVPECPAISSSESLWMREYFIKNDRLLRSYSDYLLHTFAPFSSAGVNLIFSAPRASMSPHEFERQSDELARLIEALEQQRP
ncbi:MAG: IS1634 family transposase, partial [Gammaproteobacteria bacterium]|nr:IS1634 family transposase [Gammaproteobacteria bacterium]